MPVKEVAQMDLIHLILPMDQTLATDHLIKVTVPLVRTHVIETMLLELTLSHHAMDPRLYGSMPAKAHLD